MTTETRSGIEVRQSGGSLTLRLLRLGVPGQGPAGLREVFDAPPAPMPASIPINLQHERGIRLADAAAVSMDGDVLEARADFPPGVRELVALGRLTGASVEMRVNRDRIVPDPSGASIRHIEDWQLIEAGIVHEGAAGGSGIELRRRIGGVSSGFRLGSALDCRCGAGDCDTATIDPAGLDIPDDTAAFLGNFGQPLGPVTSTVRRGRVTVRADIRGTSYGRDLIEAGERNLIVRPFPDATASEFEKRGRNQYWTRLRVAAWIFAFTDKTGGFDAPSVTTGESRGLDWSRRRYLV